MRAEVSPEPGLTLIEGEPSASVLQIDLESSEIHRSDNVPPTKPTPLPIYPLLSIYLILLAEPIAGAVIYPFINQFVRETGITGGDEKKTGYYAGIIESMFCLAEALTVVQWGYLSDRVGRRPILLCGLAGLTIAMLIFGSSIKFLGLVVSPCLQRVFDGNIGVSKSVIAELTDSTNRGDAYAVIPLLWSIGTTTAPVVGGLLSNAAIRWPENVGRIVYIRAHPYFLPCFVAGCFSFTTFIFVWFSLKETLPSLVAKEELRRHQKNPSDDVVSDRESTTLIDHGDNQNYGTSPSEFASHSTGTVANSAVFTRTTPSVLVNDVCLTFIDMCHFVLLALMYSTAIEFDGLGLDPFRIGMVLGTFGFVNSIVQIKFLGGFIRKYGVRSVYKVSFSCLLGCFGMYPAMHFFAKRAGGLDGFVVAFKMMIYMAYASIQVLLVESVSEGGPMGTVNGVAQMIGSMMRTVAPTFASSLFSISKQRGLASGNLVFYILIAMTLLGIQCTTLFPRKSR